MKSQKKYSLVIDTTGLRCPLPLLKVQKNINSLRKNREALIITDDPMAEIDLKHFCLNNNYLLEEIKDYQGGDEQFFLIKMDQEI
jgi:tRNA 2-thiouridine synthesizing protein A